MTEENKLLREYAATGSQSAFAELARRYVDLVYSSARRQLYGDAHDAEDVTQAVFLVLAEKAKSIPADRPLSAWLIKVTGYCAANVRRANDRRATHERRAADMARITDTPDAEPDWQSLSPLLDQGLNKLPAADRDALLLRFLEKKSLRQVGEALGISEEAAQKRVVRAVDKLRGYFQRIGVTTMSASALTTLLAAKSLETAPAGVLAAVSSTATAAASSAAATTSAGSIAKGAIAVMTAQKAIAVTAVAAAVLLIAGAGVVAVKSMNAPKPPPVAATGAAGAVTQTADALTFADGTGVKLVTVSEALDVSSIDNTSWLSSLLGVGATARPSAGDTEIWWDIGGKIVPPPPIQPFNGAVGGMPGYRPVRMVFEITGPNRRNAAINVTFPGMQSSAGTFRTIGQQLFNDRVMLVPDTTDRVELSIGVASGPWRQDAVAEVAPSAPSTGPALLTIESIAEEQGKTVAELTLGPLQWTDSRYKRYVAIVAGGRQIPAQQWNVSNNRVTARFPCGKGQIQKIALQSQPFEYGKLTNVPIKPSPEMIRTAMHRYALEHPQIIRDRAQKLFDDIAKADYKKPEPADHFGYTVNHDMPAWWTWVCAHFSTNPIAKVELGEVKSGGGLFNGIPMIPYTLTLKDGTQLTGLLPVQWDTTGNEWNPLEGLDWHLRPGN